jgi:hypothetical protein
MTIELPARMLSLSSARTFHEQSESSGLTLETSQLQKKKDGQINKQIDTTYINLYQLDGLTRAITLRHLQKLLLPYFPKQKRES